MLGNHKQVMKKKESKRWFHWCREMKSFDKFQFDSSP